MRWMKEYCENSSPFRPCLVITITVPDMLDRLNSLLRQRFDDSPDVGEDVPVEEQSCATVTTFTPAPLPPMVGDMSDRAEAAIDELSETLKDWFETDLRTLFDAWQRIEDTQNRSATPKDLFRAAHNLSGMGETYGQPHIGRVCKSLCRLIDSGTFRRNVTLAQLHIDACRALHSSGDSGSSAGTICTSLEAEVAKLSAA